MTCAKMAAMDAAATQISESEEENNNEGEVNQIYHPKMSLNCHVASFATSGSSTSSGNKINNNMSILIILVWFVLFLKTEPQLNTSL